MVGVVLVVLSRGALAGAAEHAAAGKEVTLIGLALNNYHLYEKRKYVFFQAYDGTPEIKAEFEKILAEYFPDKGLDADAARKLQDQFMTRLRYEVDGPLLEELHKVVNYSAPYMALTGVISQRDGKRWITASKYEKLYAHVKNPKYSFPFSSFPAKLLTPERPFVMPDKEPLALKIGDALSLRCIYVAPGRFFMGEPLYQAIHGNAAEDAPHMVTLTKGYYLAEHPITQEMFAAVTGYNPTPEKYRQAKAPVNVSCVDMYKFCERLSAKTGRKVRIPTAAEWEYAARCGTSNPKFPQKYQAQEVIAVRGKRPPVKSSQPNAWGFYDIFCEGWVERVSDSRNDHEDQVDPEHIPPQDKSEATRSQKHGHLGESLTCWLGNPEFIGSERGPGEGYCGVVMFRIVVEAAPPQAGHEDSDKKLGSP
jgi:hypothetical protein